MANKDRIRFKSVCFVHSWRTLVVSASVKNIKNNLDKTAFICTRKLANICKQCGLNVIDLDPYFSIPYTYMSHNNNWGDLRNLCRYLKDSIQNVESLYIPHTQDP